MYISAKIGVDANFLKHMENGLGITFEEVLLALNVKEPFQRC